MLKQLLHLLDRMARLGIRWYPFFHNVQYYYVLAVDYTN